MGDRDRIISLMEDNLFLRRVQEIPEEYLLKTESELAQMFNVTRIDRALKQKLWSWYADNKRAGFNQKLSAVVVYSGVCTRQNFEHIFNKHPEKLAWLFCPPVDAETLIKEAALYALERLRDDILTMPANEKTAPIILKTAQYFIDRAYGPVEQVIRQNTTQVNVDGNKMIREVADSGIVDKFKELQSSALAKKVIDVSEPE